MAVLRAAVEFNAKCDPPQEEAEVMHAVKSAWDYEIRGLNRVGQHGVWFETSEANALITTDIDAYVLLSYLRANNGPDSMRNGAEAKRRRFSPHALTARRRLLGLQQPVDRRLRKIAKRLFEDIADVATAATAAAAAAAAAAGTGTAAGRAGVAAALPDHHRHGFVDHDHALRRCDEAHRVARPVKRGRRSARQNDAIGKRPRHAGACGRDANDGCRGQRNANTVEVRTHGNPLRCMKAGALRPVICS